MQTHGYDRSEPWRQALALLEDIAELTKAFDEDPFGLAGKLRSLAAELPQRCAGTFEQQDYTAAQQHAQSASEHLFKLLVQAQVAAHLKLISPKQLKHLRLSLDQLDAAITALPDELFEDDGLSEAA